MDGQQADDDALEIREFELDSRNLNHMAARGTDGNLIHEIAADSPAFRLNPPATSRTGTHLMIGEDTGGRAWTIVLIVTDEALGVWRPITGSPSTNKEVLTWRDVNSRHEPSEP